MRGHGSGDSNDCPGSCSYQTMFSLVVVAAASSWVSRYDGSKYSAVQELSSSEKTTVISCF
jgi:hypothetical protein